MVLKQSFFSQQLRTGHPSLSCLILLREARVPNCQYSSEYLSVFFPTPHLTLHEHTRLTTTLALNTFSIRSEWVFVRNLPCACLLSTSTLCLHHHHLQFASLCPAYTPPSPSRSILDVSETRRSTVRDIDDAGATAKTRVEK